MNLNVLLPVLVAILALAFLDPFQILMPSMLAEIILGCLVLITGFYSTVIFKEKTFDEREEKIRALSHQYSYLVAVVGLVGIITYYLLTKNHVYPEMVILLVVLVTTKTAVHLYAEKNL